MKNAILMGMEFDRMLPAAEIPACTEGYEASIIWTPSKGTWRKR